MFSFSALDGMASTSGEKLFFAFLRHNNKTNLKTVEVKQKT